jgi:hypothetical protein
LNNNFRNILKVFRNIERASRPDRRLIEVFIQILQLTIRPTLAPGSDVRALVMLLFFYVLHVVLVPWPLLWFFSRHSSSPAAAGFTRSFLAGPGTSGSSRQQLARATMNWDTTLLLPQT